MGVARHGAHPSIKQPRLPCKSQIFFKHGDFIHAVIYQYGQAILQDQIIGKEGYSRCAWFVLKDFNCLTEVVIMKWLTSTFRLCINPNCKMEVDSDSEQPSGSGVVAGKDKKRYCRIRVTCAKKRLSSLFYHSVQIWSKEVECCGSMGLGHCCRQLRHLQVGLLSIEYKV